MNNNNKILRTELNKMAGEAKMKNYLKYNRFEFAEKLGIEIPKTKQKAPLIKIPFRRVSRNSTWNKHNKNIFFNCHGRG